MFKPQAPNYTTVNLFAKHGNTPTPTKAMLLTSNVAQKQTMIRTKEAPTQVIKTKDPITKCHLSKDRELEEELDALIMSYESNHVDSRINEVPFVTPHKIIVTKTNVRSFVETNNSFEIKEDTIDHNREVLVEDGDIRTLSSDLRLLTHNEHSDGTMVPSPIRIDHVQ